MYDEVVGATQKKKEQKQSIQSNGKKTLIRWQLCVCVCVRACRRVCV